MFRLGMVKFNIDDDESSFNLYSEDGKIQFDLDILTKTKKYHREQVSPSLIIQAFDTECTDVRELAGLTFSVGSIDEADEREDLFYLYEHEPFVEYRLQIKEANENSAHILLLATVVKDGYAEPYTTAKLKVDCVLKVKW